MNKVKKIGCLDKMAVNYDASVEVACERCCITSGEEKKLKNTLDFIFFGKRNPNKQVDYLIYATKYIDKQPLFNLPSQAEGYGLQIGCKGYHEHIISNKKFYMACESHEMVTQENKLKPTCEDYIEHLSSEGEVIWKRTTPLKQQSSCCKEMQKDGYKWDRINRRCIIPEEENTNVGNHQIIGYVNNIPVWYTQGAALEYGNIIKCDGYHTYNMYGTTGFISCKDSETAINLIGEIECKNTRERMDGSLTFMRLSPTNSKKYGEACCLEHAYLGYLWNGRGCVKNYMELTWSCINNLTTEIYDGTGEYSSFKECLTFCENNKK